MSRIYLTPLIVFVFLSCTSASQLSKTRWECKISETCLNYIIFENDSSVNLYNCEVDEIVYGRYFMKNDTLFIQTQKGQYDDEFKEGSRHKHEAYSFYLLLREDKIFSPAVPEIKYLKTHK